MLNFETLVISKLCTHGETKSGGVSVALTNFLV